MSPEERDIIGKFLARVGGASTQPALGASVPATTPLPAIDPEADRFIREQFATHPEAPYRVTQMAFVQEAALAEAQNRLRQMEYQLQQAQQQLQLAQQQAQSAPPQSRGLFGSIFGSAPPVQPPPYAQQPQYAPPPYTPMPQASYPPGYQPGMFGRGGSGFLGSALTTAAGVAGGVLAADALTSMFSGGHNYGGGFGGMGGGFGGGFGGGEVINETIVNNYGDSSSGADPWAGGGAAPSSGADPWAGGGGGANDDSWSSGDSGGSSDSSWDSGGASDSGGGDDSF